MQDDTPWLIRSGSDRERMLDMDRRLQPVRRGVFALMATVLLACGPWLGWWTVIPIALAGVIFRVADLVTHRTARPERAMFVAWLTSQLTTATAAALTGGPRSAVLAWLAIPMITLTARFSDRGILLGAATSLGLLLAVAFGIDARAVLDNPVLVVAPATLILSTTMLSVPLMRSDLHHREEAVVDGLTGMLNRRALAVRAAELTAQSEVTGDPVALILADVDDFKAINDSFGHAVGDAVLRDVASCLRAELRAFDLAYRIGGEEFLVIVPGATAEQATTLAESLRRAVATTEHGGRRVTMSFGVAASDRGEPLVWETVFAQADAALYLAKGDGRNRTSTADGGSALISAA